MFDWFGQHLHLITEPSMRHYVRAAELRRAGMPWVQAVPLQLSDKAVLVAQLKADPGFPTEEARAAEFIRRGYGCRATYFNHARKLSPASVGTASMQPLRSSTTGKPETRAA